VADDVEIAAIADTLKDSAYVRGRPAMTVCIALGLVTAILTGAAICWHVRHVLRNDRAINARIDAQLRALAAALPPNPADWQPEN
jgi:hypothetical protein